ncbi:MAG: hypothetical protein M0P64_02995 [Candidatus Pacebacteria bacterium]|jgi:hypothetical protein|nr:hypothetical protein [Candidatus Paceibacterota bacterium]
MNIRDEDFEQTSIYVALQRAHDLTEIILVGHHRMEILLEEYVRNLVPNRHVLRVEHLTFDQKLELVLSDIDLPAWCAEDGCDDAYYRIAEEMLGYIFSLNELRTQATIEILACIHPSVLDRHANSMSIERQARRWLALPPSTTEKELRDEVAGHIACVHAYFEGFTETMFGEDNS